MRIGVDFDNTIVCFDPLFYTEAVRKKLISPQTPANKLAVRDALRSQGNDADWTELQGSVYGDKISAAKPFPGVLEFFPHHASAKNDVFNVSHKTKTPALGPSYDLHGAAQTWLKAHNLFSKNVFFETSISMKMDRIANLKCDVFIDDLLEFLTNPDFPKNVERILFSPGALQPNVPFRQAASWAEIQTWIQ